MAKSLEKLYRFRVFENVRYFESRYYAEKYMREVYSVKFHVDPDNASYERVGDEFRIYFKLFV